MDSTTTTWTGPNSRILSGTSGAKDPTLQKFHERPDEDPERFLDASASLLPPDADRRKNTHNVLLLLQGDAREWGVDCYVHNTGGNYDEFIRRLRKRYATQKIIKGPPHRQNTGKSRRERLLPTFHGRIGDDPQAFLKKCLESLPQTSPDDLVPQIAAQLRGNAADRWEEPVVQCYYKDDFEMFRAS